MSKKNTVAIEAKFNKGHQDLSDIFYEILDANAPRTDEDFQDAMDKVYDAFYELIDDEGDDEDESDAGLKLDEGGYH